MLRVVKTNTEGIFLLGAKMVATAAPYAGDIVVYPLQRIPADRPELAQMVIVPVSSPGLHLVCRESFAANVPDPSHPLSAHYDEMDAILFFEDVLVPWERVLIPNHPEALWYQHPFGILTLEITPMLGVLKKVLNELHRSAPFVLHIRNPAHSFPNPLNGSFRLLILLIRSGIPVFSQFSAVNPCSAMVVSN